MARYANAGAGLVSNVLLARALGPADYGFVIAVISVNAAGVLISEWSTEQHLLRLVSRGGLEAAQRRIASATRFRCVLGPIPSAVLMIGFLASRPDIGGSQLLGAGFLVVSATLGFSSLGPPILLGAGHTTAFVVLNQMGGFLTSAAVACVALLYPTVLAACAAFALAAVLTAGVQVVVCARHDVDLSPFRRSDASIPLLFKELAPAAIAQGMLLAPWRLIPVVVAAAMAPVPAGQVLAGLRYWEQVAVPGVAVAQIQARQVAASDGNEIEGALHRSIQVLGLAVLAGIPISLAYVRFVLGSDYAALQTAVIAGAGMVLAAGLAQSLVPLLIVGGAVPAARRTGTLSVALLGLLLAALWQVASVGLALATVSVVMGCGLFGGVALSRRGAKLSHGLSVATASATVGCALVGWLCG